MKAPDDASGAQWRSLNDRLVSVLKPFAAPVAISFHAPGEEPPAARIEGEHPEGNERGRTGRVPAGCVFWIRGASGTFATVAADHGNCSVGCYTHGFLSLEEAAGKDDVEAVLAAGWVDEQAVMSLPHVAERPGAGRLRAARRELGGAGRGAAQDQRALPDDPEGCLSGHADRGQAAVSRGRDGEGAGCGRGQRGLCAQPRAHRHALRRDDLRHSRPKAAGGSRKARSDRRAGPGDGEVRLGRREALCGKRGHLTRASRPESPRRRTGCSVREPSSSLTGGLRASTGLGSAAAPTSAVRRPRPRPLPIAGRRPPPGRRGPARGRGNGR